MLNETIKDDTIDITLVESVHKEDAINIIGLLPCPVRIPLLERFATLSNLDRINHNLKAASEGLDWLKEEVEIAKTEDDLADIYISAGFDLFFEDHLMKKFKDDKEIVIASIKKCCKNFIHCSKRLKNNKEVILTAINNCYYDFYNNMEENDKIDYIKKRIKNIDIILENTKLKNDPDILNQVIKKIRIV